MRLYDTLLHPGAERWVTLTRRSAADTVAGRVKLTFGWDVSPRGLLALKIRALERVLAQRLEVVMALTPVPAAVALAWASGAADAAGAGAAADVSAGAGAAARPRQQRGWALPQVVAALRSESAPREGLGGALIARHEGEELNRTLLVTVLAPRGLGLRRVTTRTLSQSDLPSPSVSLAVEGRPRVFTPPASRTVAPRWPTGESTFAFEGVLPNEGLRLALYDRADIVASVWNKAPLGEGRLAQEHVQVGAGGVLARTLQPHI